MSLPENMRRLAWNLGFGMCDFNKYTNCAVSQSLLRLTDGSAHVAKLADFTLVLKYRKTVL
jgi:hypothetical protein